MNSALIGLPTVLLGGASAWISWYFWQEARDLRAAGVDAQATLLKKFRKAGDTFLFGIENYFVTAAFSDRLGRSLNIDIRVPSRQWHMLREGSTAAIVYLPSNPQRARVISRFGQKILGGILLYMTASSVMMVVFGLYFVFGGHMDLNTMPTLQSVSIAAPPPSKFDKNGVARVLMSVSPRHDRITVVDEDSGGLSIRELPSGRLVASAKGKGWRLLGWRPDGARLAVTQAGEPLILDAESLQPAVGETASWNPPWSKLTNCPEPNAPLWNPATTRFAAPCGINVLLMSPPNSVLLQGHTDRVLGLAWSPSGGLLASAGEDNYVRVWDTRHQRCVAVSEDYPYPRAVYFSDEHTVVVIDVALRQYQMRYTP